MRIALQALGMEPEDAAPYLLQLLGVREGTDRLAELTPEVIKTRTFEMLRQTNLHGSRQRPLILALENLQRSLSGSWGRSGRGLSTWSCISRS